MITPDIKQGYIEELAGSIRASEEIKHERLVELMFAIIDHFCDHILTLPGPNHRIIAHLLFEADVLNRAIDQ